MRIMVDDLITLGDKKYITLDSIYYEDNNYIFVNEVTKDEEPTKSFYVFKVVDNSCLLIDDTKILDLVLPIFSSNVQKQIDMFKNKETYNID